MYNKYGKSLGDILDIKNNFISKNLDLYKENIKLASVALAQPKREKCKNCDKQLINEISFIKQGIGYKFCDNCNHLNADFDDTENFAKAVYVDEVTDYSKYYSAESLIAWNSRVEKIYNPKANFLSECLENDFDIETDEVIDIGAGSGYFIKALLNSNYKNIRGYEVSSNQVKLANSMLNDNLVIGVGINDLVSVIKNTKAKMVSMIGVLEHLTNPREILKAISENPYIKYYYISVPLFSFSVFFEIMKDNMFNRHLAGGHTHLYTNESIEYFCNEFNFSIKGKWQFGADAMDLYRMALITLEEKNVSKGLVELFSKNYLRSIDSIQLSLDKSDFSSEVHVVIKK
ncbi:methyltransferase domain-containing protein [Lysinibacillus fusiformis]|uniref:methyltransferase domain-containing protein n=1 Tax=Lysinibacillus TaxID=400634 RepID=UPI0011BB5741|nr:MULTISPECIES: methyltransferase domain-containing protein [Lysinibacillus]MBG9692381.1 hypothetical protein [Lysinibacillus sphaericus]QEA00651.1 methyltransferase domain-containing protein [Lysinibacillus fusiformis]